MRFILGGGGGGGGVGILGDHIWLSQAYVAARLVGPGRLCF